MKYYTGQTVWDEALDRVRRVFQEFEHVSVSFSGGKDSTVVLNLALRVAEETGRLPLPVMFLDQEAEWAAVIDYVRDVMHDPRVKPYWLQIPFRLFNATSTAAPWLYCWEPGAEWIRPKEPDSIHANVYGSDRFHPLFGEFLRVTFGGAPACALYGVRAEESPARYSGMTAYATYKDITWGQKTDPDAGLYSFGPIYDWALSDVWKAIHDNGWAYCRLYDLMWQHGIPIREMRVSNVHHETALRSLTFLQEIEPDTWRRVTRRLRGVNSVRHVGTEFFIPRQPPPMFSGWREYRDYLWEHLLPDGEPKEKMRRAHLTEETKYTEDVLPKLYRSQVAAILKNDYEGTGHKTFMAAHGRKARRYRERGGTNGSA